MSVRSTILVAFVLAGSGIACASAGPSASSGAGPSASVADTETGGIFRLSGESNAVSVALDAPPDTVWAVLPGIYKKLGIPAEIHEPSLRRIGTGAYMLSRLDGKRTTEWVRCGNQGSGPSSGGMYRTRLSIMTTVRDVGGGKSDLVSEVKGSAAAVEGTSTGAVACASTGALEQRIRALVAEELAR
jgi:hypothetical protein